MVRTQIQLPDEQARRLRRAAQAQGISMSEVVRRCIERGLESEGSAGLWQRALAAAGAFQDPDGEAQVSGRHDEYLADAYR
jgi:Arc/MetJ-type ribon-helix-helix transcriptional regulator